MPTNGQFAVGELVTASDANSMFVRGYRNRIINGAFVVNQRGYTSGTNLASGSYGFDRWKSGYTNTALTFTAGSQATTVTISASGVLQQIIERENMPAGTYILSWTGTATGRVYNSGGAAPSYATSPVQVTLDGSANVVVEFTASGGTKTLGLVQLEAGTAYSPFEYRHRSEEIILCQRYYEDSGYPTYAVPTAVTGQGAWIPAASAYTLCAEPQFRTTKRAAPTVTIYNTNTLGAGSVTEYIAGGAFVTNRTAAAQYPTTTKFGVSSAGLFAAGRDYNFTWKAEAEL